MRLKITWYSISDSEWMTTTVSFSWFNKFSVIITERPLLLVFDGHLTHLSFDVIEKEIEENIIIVKLPPHTTDLLQPLDVACFGPLKRMWSKKLNDWVSQFGTRQPVRKPQYIKVVNLIGQIWHDGLKVVNLIGQIWHDGLSGKNIFSGFEATGIYPVGSSKYKTERLNPQLLRRYKAWVEAGKPQNLMEDLANGLVATPKKTAPLIEQENGHNTPEPQPLLQLS